MSQNEDELLDLMAVAKKQLATVQAATDAMQKQRGELYDAIAQLKRMRVTVAEEAKKGAAEGLSGVTSRANAALRACLRSSEQQPEKGQVDHLQAGIQFAFAVLP